MKKYLILIFCLALSACSAPSADFQPEKTEFQKVSAGGENHYFRYPQSSLIVNESNAADAYLSHDGCQIYFASDDDNYADDREAIDTKATSRDGRNLESRFLNDILISYAIIHRNPYFVFYVYRGDNDVSDCIPLVKELAETFTDELVYVNEEYDFEVVLLDDYKVTYLPSDEGVLLKRWTEYEEEVEGEMVMTGYNVELTMTAGENFMGYEDLAALIQADYAGFTIDFVDYVGVSGVYVDEGSDKVARRHFYALSTDGDVLYHGQMRVPGKHYNAHGNDFEQFMHGVRVER
jgi:hypothetical protein